jgi:hypothetical protein
MFSHSELIFRIEIKCAIFKRIIAKFGSHIFKAQTNIFRIFGRSCIICYHFFHFRWCLKTMTTLCHPLKFLPENLPCLQFASKPASVTRRFFFRGKRLMMSCVKTLIVQSNRYMFSYTAQLG